MGRCLHRLDDTQACMVVDSATVRDIFREYMREVLVPALRPADIVILENLSAHDNGETRQLVESVPARLLSLPPSVPISTPWRRCGAR